MSYEWWVMSDGNWVTKKWWPNNLLASRVLKKFSFYTLKGYFIYFSKPFHNSPYIPSLIFHIIANTSHLFIHLSLSSSLTLSLCHSLCLEQSSNQATPTPRPSKSATATLLSNCNCTTHYHNRQFKPMIITNQKRQFNPNPLIQPKIIQMPNQMQK